MKQKHRIYLGLQVLLVFASLFSVSPFIKQTQPRDPGFFLYAGSQLLLGKAIYVDVWDHKPPLIHILNAIGLWISDGSIWGIWSIEFLSLSTALTLAFILLRRYFEDFSIFLASISGLSILVQILHGGNYTEEFAIPLQIACIYFALRLEKENSIWMGLACGASFGLLFFLRQDLISIGLAILIFFALQTVKAKFPAKEFISILAGFGAASTGLIIYLANQSSLNEFWEAAFLYNFHYTNLGFLERLISIKNVFVFIFENPMLLMQFIAWLILLQNLILHFANSWVSLLRKRWIGWVLFGMGVLSLLVVHFGEQTTQAQKGIGYGQYSLLFLGLFLLITSISILFSNLPKIIHESIRIKKGQVSQETVPFVTLLVLWYPIEIAMITLSGRFYLHYFITLIPSSIFLFSFIIDKLLKVAKSWKLNTGKYLMYGAWISVLIIQLIITPIIPLKDLYAKNSDQQIIETAAYIIENTKSNENILVWGAEPSIYFFSNREPPTRYSYLYPLLNYHSATQSPSLEFYEDLTFTEPIMIIDTQNIDFPKIHIDHKGMCSTKYLDLSDGLKQVMEYICIHYSFQEEIGPEGWKVYYLNR